MDMCRNSKCVLHGTSFHHRSKILLLLGEGWVSGFPLGGKKEKVCRGYSCESDCFLLVSGFVGGGVSGFGEIGRYQVLLGGRKGVDGSWGRQQGG